MTRRAIFQSVGEIKARRIIMRPGQHIRPWHKNWLVEQALYACTRRVVRSTLLCVQNAAVKHRELDGRKWWFPGFNGWVFSDLVFSIFMMDNHHIIKNRIKLVSGNHPRIISQSTRLSGDEEKLCFTWHFGINARHVRKSMFIRSTRTVPGGSRNNQGHVLWCLEASRMSRCWFLRSWKIWLWYEK